MIRLSADRVRSIIEHAKTEKELVRLFRYHKIPFFAPEDGSGFLIPSRRGILHAKRKRNRFEIHNTAPVPFRSDTEPLPLASCSAWVDRLEVI